MSLPAVPNCSPDEDGNCTPLTLVETGSGFILVDTETKCAREASGSGVAFSNGVTAYMADGSEEKPIELTGIPNSPYNQTFPFLPYFNSAGRILKMEPTTEEVPLYLAMVNGEFVFTDIRPTVCFDAGDICGDCENDFVAGFRSTEGGGLCLTKIPFEAFTSAVDDWEDTQTIDIQGNGVEPTPYTAHVKISPDAGNWLEARENGLYMRIPVSALAGNIISLLADGLYASTETSYD